MSELNLDKCKAAFVDLSDDERKHFVEMAALIVGIKLNSEALTEHLRLKEEECKQLQQDRSELVDKLKELTEDVLSGSGALPLSILRAKELLEKHK